MYRTAVDAGRPTWDHVVRIQQKGSYMGIIAFLVLGLLAGAIAKAILPGDDPGGIIVTMVIGVAGALLGGFLGGLLFDVDPVDEFWSLSTWLAAIIGALILLGIYRMVVGNRGRRAAPGR